MNNLGTLIILSGNEHVREIALSSFNKNKISFGRDRSNDIVIESGIISRLHGYFELLDDTLCIYDYNSTNGLFVNDIYYGTAENGESKLCTLHDGDIIRIDNDKYERIAENGIIMLYTTRKSEGSWKEFYLDNKDAEISIGRSKSCDIRIDNIRVSRQHAILQTVNNQTYITDNKSSNGTFVNGEPISTRTKLNERDVITIGHSVILYTHNLVLYKTATFGTRVLMQGVSRIVKTKNGDRKILNNANLQIEPNEFVAIIGGSGSGKTTLMNAMSGYEQASIGSVFVNSVSLYDNYKLLKSSIGYVPQQDIIYENLTLTRMLEYSAQLRMSNDVSETEIKTRIQEVLEMVELSEHQDKMIRSLSGGQKKRASIAVELLGDPGLFFLDEPTSGLDPGTEENLMKSLKKLSKQNNKTIIMVTHTTQNLHLCDKIVLMGANGNICFFGSPSDCLKEFGINNLTEVYNKVSSLKDTEKYAREYYKNYGIHQRFKKTVAGKTPSPKKGSWINQAKTLTLRYLQLIINDRQRLLVMGLQPILIGLLIAFVASDDVFSIYNDTKSILFALSCASIWVGLFNSIQEICKERIILKREYMANLKLTAYIFSKMAVQFLISILQSLVLLIVFSITIGLPEKGIVFESPFLELFLTLVFTTYSSAGIGIIISSISKNSDKAMTIAPFILIIQLLFSGILFTLGEFTEKISYFTVSRWSVAALGSTSNLNDLDNFEGMVRSFEEIFEFSSSNLFFSWIVLISFVLVCAIASTLILTNISKDSR